MMYAILGLHLGGVDYAENDADWLAVPVTDATLRAIMTRIDIAKLAKQQDGGFYSLTYWDTSVTLFGNDHRHYRLGQLVDSPTMYKVADVATSRLVVTPTGVRWEGRLRYPCVYWATDEVSVEKLREWQQTLAKNLMSV